MMEQIHGIDISWMTHHGGGGSLGERTPPPRSSLPTTHRGQSPVDPADESNAVSGACAIQGNTDPAPNTNGAQVKQIPPRPGFTRASSTSDAHGVASSALPTRRPSWFSNISQKFSGGAGQSPPQANNSPTKDAEISVPKSTPAKNAVLQHAARYQGEGPYIPAPPRTGQTGILHVLRKLSSSSSAQLGSPLKSANNHGLVERKILNVDRHRERCPLEELQQAKLRRVAFCVDVEIAPMPKYLDVRAKSSSKVGSSSAAGDKSGKRKLVEKGAAESLEGPKQTPKEAEGNKNQNANVEISGEQLPKEARTESPEVKNASIPAQDYGCSKKKEKKKRSEEERKARKEKKRKLAEDSGQIPIELHLDPDDSDPSAPATPKTQVVPTTNPVRIYRRCCQLREAPILKKITEQLLAPSNTTPTGVVEKIDLSNYWMQLPDLVTLGDYLAVVPVKEINLENCGLSDEGLRVILAGLLAAKKTSSGLRPVVTQAALVDHGGFVERLVLKNNKIGPEGWKYLCLFIYMCRSLVSLDLADIPFPQSAAAQSAATDSQVEGSRCHQQQKKMSLDICSLLARSMAERLAGGKLEMLNLSNTGLSHTQFGQLMDGIMQCGVRRLGLAHLKLDVNDLEHVKRYLATEKCEALDLGGNDLRDQCENLASVIDGKNSLWALSLAECNLIPASLCKLLPQLSKLSNFRFLDLSHNQELFRCRPSAVAILRRYLPKMDTVKRVHLSDCALNSEQLIALAEVIPEMKSIAHISFLQNPELTKLADANTEESQEEASALYASLLAATRLSPRLVCVDIGVPTETSGEIVKALAKQIVAYCLRNMERLPLQEGGPAPNEEASAYDAKDPEYPDVLQHFVGRDMARLDDEEIEPGDDYIVGGTGVAKALACCLNHRGDISRRNSGEFARDLETGVVLRKPALRSGKAKDVSKHLLLSARRIRKRLEPALAKAKGMADRSAEERNTYCRFIFLQSTLDGIIQRFEDEFPETREAADSGISIAAPDSHQVERSARRNSTSSGEAEIEPAAAGSDIEEEGDLKNAVAQDNSNLSLSSLALDREEGAALRTGHKFRSSWLTAEQYQVLSSGGFGEVEQDANQVRILNEIIDELDVEDLSRMREAKGAPRVFQENRQEIVEACRAADPEYWRRFVESQEKAKANVNVVHGAAEPCYGQGGGVVGPVPGAAADGTAVTE